MRHVGDESVESVEKGDRRDFEHTCKFEDWVPISAGQCHFQALRETRIMPSTARRTPGTQTVGRINRRR
jgi:hypothetical protein